MIKNIFLVIIASLTISCGVTTKLPDTEKSAVNELLNQWHKDVATFDFDAYFDKMTDDGVFVGTDASEVWSKEQFMAFSKPYFDQKQTWDFKPLQRNIYFDSKEKIAWFDETLDTWMGICRGSGVVIKTDEGWKIQHYVLSVTVPNEKIKEVIEAKKETETLILKKLIKP